MKALFTEADSQWFCWKKTLLLFCAICTLAASSRGQKKCTDIAPDSSFNVHEVQIMGRWVSAQLKQTVTKIIGNRFHDSKVSAAVALVAKESATSEAYFPPQLAGAVAVSYTTVNYCAVPDTPGQVDIVIYPRYLRIDLFHIANNYLPVPRSPKPTFYESVPKSLLAFSPVVGFDMDRRYGPSLLLQTATDLLHLSNPSAGTKSLKLNLGLEARKSASENFYKVGSHLQALHSTVTETGFGWEINSGFVKSLQPLGAGQYEFNQGSFQASLQRNLRSAFAKKLAFGVGLHSLSNAFDTSLLRKVQNMEKGYSLFFVTDGLIAKGFTRLGIWFDQGFPDNSARSYQRIAGKIGYFTSFRLKSDGHQTFDVEATTGIGKAWGRVPVYSQFFAGNRQGNFLYESLNAATVKTLPEGPVVRSFGEKEASVLNSTTNITGGTSYWHLNLNFSIPVKRYSRPLIPPIVINENTGATLQTKLKSLAKGSAESAIAVDLIDNKGYPDNSQTDSLAKAMVAKEILPMIEFVTDRANVFAFKPMLLFDVAGLKQKGLDTKTFLAAGAGVELTVVIARFSMGYMKTLAPSSERSKGNFFLQLRFQNFF